MIQDNSIKQLFDTKYLKVYDMNADGDHSYNVASRREFDRLPARLRREEYKDCLPDAVSLVVVLKVKNQEPKLILSKEYRYPAGQYLLSVPAGLIDPEDWNKADAVEITAVRELEEETGIKIQEGDKVKVINPYLFSSPGITDEGNALVYMEINRDSMPGMSQEGAVGMEKFNGFEILTKAQVQELLMDGYDRSGVFFPVWTWCAMMFFMGV